jgi:dTDP-4-amino-4,6-dideoxygalactose transaminase
MIPRFKPQYNYLEWLAALKPIKGNVPKYEQAFATRFGCEYGVMFSHGRTGIYALLKVWGLENAEVICPAYTCVVVPHAIVLSNNIPVFVDCGDHQFNMSLEGIREAITEKTRVVIPTHLFGYPMDVERIQQIVLEAERKYKHKIYVIQDCAHSYGARWGDTLVSEYGDAAVFGSNISKIINSVFGGMVITRNKGLAQQLRLWRQENLFDLGWRKSVVRFLYFVAVNLAFNHTLYGLVNWLERKKLLDYFVKYYADDEIDFPRDWNYAPSELEARIGLVQLSKYEKIVALRKKNALKVINEMQGKDGIWLLPYDDHATYSHIVAVVDNRDEWVEKYLRRGMQLGTLIEYSIPMMPAYEKYRKTIPPNSVFYSKSLINFPVYVDV